MTIAEVAAKVGLSTDTLRYYERVGLLPPIPRNANGIRNYGEAECGWIEFVKCMREAGLSIEALAEYVRLQREGDATAKARLELLVEQRRLLEERANAIKGCIERLDYKIKLLHGI